MASARHHFKSGTLSDADIKAQIVADAAASRQAQRDLASAGQYKHAAMMGEAVDEALDELNAANSGTWRPKHA
jgi:hypothetical protein